MTMTERSAQWLLRLYPAAWRQRYAAEALDLLEARPPTWSDVGNFLVHAIYTHLHPELTVTGEESLRERLAILMRAVRSSEVLVFCAFVVAIVVWLQFGGLIDGGPYAPLVDTGAAWPFIRIPAGNALGTALAIQSLAVDLAFIGVLAGGLPLALAAWRRSPHARRYFLVPVAGFLGAFLPVPIALFIVGPVATINLTFSSPITVAYVVWFVGLAAVSARALSRAIADSDLDDRLVRFALTPTALTAGALVLMLGTTVSWGVIAHLQAPHRFDRGDLTLGLATLATWVLDVTLLAGAASVAVVATIRGLTARSAANTA